MSNDGRRQRIRNAGSSAYRTAVLAGATVLVLAMFFGMAFLVYQEKLSDGPLVLFAGVIVGYVLRAVQNR